jgi:hypothetical protein
MERKLISCLAVLVFALAEAAGAQRSVARQWNEAQLNAVRRDFARPTVHARNLFHAAIIMYDGWAAYDQVAATYLLGKTVGGYTCKFNGIAAPANVQTARNETISYAMYGFLKHRFQRSPGAAASFAEFDSLMNVLGYNPAFTSSDYSNGSAAALGNYLALSMIEYGLQDGANEQNDYAYQYYQPLNPPMIPVKPGNPTLVDPNRWQPMSLKVFIDQNGNIIPGDTVQFVTPEWGRVVPFALTAADRKIYQRDGADWWVYHDPGPPVLFDRANGASASSEFYRWNFSLVSTWSSHLDAADPALWDISPASIGNAQKLPETWDEIRSFYNLLQGGDASRGRAVNPRTGLPYAPQIVPRGDYARVLAEFWADGPKSETPPGHWFTIVNYVSDHPLFEKRFRGQGPILDDLEWDVKAYLALGGAVHDAGITAWSIKGWYDYTRPISTLRWMGGNGQSSDPNLPNYSPHGLALIPGFIEQVQPGEPLAGPNNENVGKIKLKAWRAHDYIGNPETEVAGVGWILSDNWWPYQRPTFVTPPFAGYISGHSTFSRAAAEVMTLLTGDEYFPGGMSEFRAARNEYLVFEDGPSVDVILQWATYRDASDQCSLSRIWGGIHPPIDDIPGRLLGRKVGINAFALAERYFTGQASRVAESPTGTSVPAKFSVHVYPNPVYHGNVLTVKLNRSVPGTTVQLYNLQGRLVRALTAAEQTFTLNTSALPAGIYFLRVADKTRHTAQRVLVMK